MRVNSASGIRNRISHPEDKNLTLVFWTSSQWLIPQNILMLRKGKSNTVPLLVGAKYNTEFL